MIMLELQMQKPIPYDEKWLQKKITNNKRPISLTLKMLHNFIEVQGKPGTQSRVDKSRVEDSTQILNDNKIQVKSKKKFLDFVLLTEDEHKKLFAEYGSRIVTDMMEKLNNYLGKTGKRYKSHYFTLKDWLRREGIKTKEMRHPPQTTSHNINRPEISPEQAQQVRKQVKNLTEKLGGKNA